jgi:hypothetical protein
MSMEPTASRRQKGAELHARGVHRAEEGEMRGAVDMRSSTIGLSGKGRRRTQAASRKRND